MILGSLKLVATLKERSVFNSHHIIFIFIDIEKKLMVQHHINEQYMITDCHIFNAYGTLNVSECK